MADFLKKLPVSWESLAVVLDQKHIRTLPAQKMKSRGESIMNETKNLKKLTAEDFASPEVHTGRLLSVMEL